MGSTTRASSLPTGRAAPNVTSFLEDRAGTLWVGTFGDGLSALDRDAGTTRVFRHDPRDAATLSDDRVMSLLEDDRVASGPAR